MNERTFTPSDDVSAIVGMFGRQLEHPEQPFTLLVRFLVRDGTQDDVVSQFAEARALTLNDPGCLAFELNWYADGKRFIVHEKWRSLADLDAHLRTAHADGLRRAYDAVIVGVPEFDVLVPWQNRTTESGVAHPARQNRDAADALNRTRRQ